jgi:hypothetical protein
MFFNIKILNSLIGFNLKENLLKIFFCSIFLFIAGLSVISCSNEEISKNDPVVSLAYDTGCFDGITTRWSEWSEGRGSEVLVAADVNCVVDGISYFLLRVRGEKLGSYSSQEIYNFTQKLFKEAEIKRTTIDDILVFKSWLVGGLDTEVSFEELNKISWFLKSIKIVAQQLTPVADKLFFKDSLSLLTEEKALVLKKSLSSISKEVKTLTKDAEVAIPLHKFDETLNRFLTDLKLETIKTDRIKSIWNLVSLSLGQTENAALTLKPSEGVVELGLRAYYIALRFKYGVMDIGWKNLASYPHLESVVNESLALINFILSYQPGNVLTKKNLSILFYEATSFMNLDYEITESLVSDALEVVFNSYFRSLELGDEQVNILAHEWQNFRDFYSQTLILQGLGFTGSMVTGRNLVGLSEMNERTIDFAWPLLPNVNGYVLNPLKDTEIIADYGGLFGVNLYRALSSVFLRSFTMDEQRRDDLTGVTITELEKGYLDLFKILNKLEILSDEEIKSWFRIFNEANLFVPRAKADEYLSFEEGVDFFALLFSGFNFSSDIFEMMNKACPVLTKSCQLSWIKSSGDSVWKNFAPEIPKYFSTIDKDEWDSFTEGFEQMARETIQKQPFEKHEILRVAIAIQYIEIFFRKYDENHDLKIDFPETVFSFDKFKSALLALPQIKGTDAEKDPSTLLSFYTFFLRKGRLPKKTLGQYVELFGWIRKVNKCASETSTGQFVVNPGVQGCEYESSRGNLMKILAFLSNSL